MNNKILIIACFLSGFYLTSGASNPKNGTLESGFVHPADSIRTSVYWYWLGDNITKEGVVKDLEAMKKAGINRAFIANIAGKPEESGKVKLFSDQWWDILHTALKKAGELNIEIGIFNCPGWSQSGGPWVKKEQAMRYLNSSEVEVIGPSVFNSKIPPPNADFQPVKLIAYRMPTKSVSSYRSLNPILTSDPKIDNLSVVMDGDNKTEISLTEKKEISIDFTTSETATVRSILIKASEKKTKALGLFYVYEGSGFRLVKSFEIDRSNHWKSVGFEPYAPICIAVPEIKSTRFRLVIKDVKIAGGIAEIDLVASPKLASFPEKTFAKMVQSTQVPWKEYMWDAQAEVSDTALIINPKTVIDISQSRASDGTILWNVPPGIWKIMQTGMTATGKQNDPATPEGRGLEVDKMSKKHIESHFDAYIAEIIRRIPAADRKTWKVVVMDSYETGGQNWTDGLLEDFTSKYGYSPLPYLPTLKGNVVGSCKASDRFLWDLRKIVAEKIAYEYVAGLREKCHQNGLTTWLENYGHWGFPAEFLQYGGQSDEVSGEFWSEGSYVTETRAASSCAHIYGKRKVSAESFTSFKKAFSRDPSQMKCQGDRYFTEGINNTVFHVYIHQPDEKQPGMNAWYGTEFNRHNTWFDYMDLFTQYFKRTNYMLQQGLYVADVAYFIGEDTPKMTGICNPALPKAYSYDFINAEVIEKRLKVQDGKLVLPDGMSYRLLVLPKLESMRPEFLVRIKELINQGAVVLGSAPKQSPSLQNFPLADQQVQTLAKEIWGKVDGITLKSAKLGKGMILSGMEMQEALDLLGVRPDCQFEKDDASLFIHRTIADGEVYFISNQSNKTITIHPQFRVTGKAPELWSSMDGSYRDLPAYQQGENATTVPLKLEAYESQFVVFRKKANQASVSDLSANFPEPQLLVDLSDNWMVSFDPSKGGPKHPVSFDKLSDWTLSQNDSVKYFSGTAVYRKTLRLNKIDSNKKILLNLGSLTAMARVKINAREVGGVWTAPWQLDITNAIKVGENSIEISIVNNWMNRLIGDSKLPAQEKKTWCLEMPYTPESPLQASGLLGPVKLLTVK